MHQRGNKPGSFLLYICHIGVTLVIHAALYQVTRRQYVIIVHAVKTREFRFCREEHTQRWHRTGCVFGARESHGVLV